MFSFNSIFSDNLCMFMCGLMYPLKLWPKFQYISMNTPFPLSLTCELDWLWLWEMKLNVFHNLPLYDDNDCIGWISWNWGWDLGQEFWKTLVRFSRSWILYCINIGLFFMLLYNWSMNIWVWQKDDEIMNMIASYECDELRDDDRCVIMRDW